MANIRLIIAYYVVTFAVIFVMSEGSYELEKNGGHGWESAHATFYGDNNGGDTMCKFFLLPYFIQITSL